MGDKTKQKLYEELFSQFIDFFPYPIAIFTPEHTLSMVNKAFEEETNMQFTNMEKGDVRILQYKINDMQLAAAVMKVFAGDTFFLEGLKNPFSMFSGITHQGIQQSDRFSKAVVFPVPVDDTAITHGVIVFMA